MSNTLYRELRAACKKRGITQSDIARRLGRGSWYITSRMCGHCDWDQGDMYTLMDMLREPYSKLHIYFPRGGMWAGSAADPEPTVEQQALQALRLLIRNEAKK